jgi:hypothetical protein
MGRRATFTAAQIERATRAARRVDPEAIVEVTRDGVIRILPAMPPPDRRDALAKAVDAWFGTDEG